MNRSYPAKILLFGEHTLLRGGRGLAVPYPRFALRWTVGVPDERLLKFVDYLDQPDFHPLLDTVRLYDETNKGARLAGDIPTGYGLGSSGAVCAAVLENYATPSAQQLNFNYLRTLLARMEGHFHGQSSGTDPLISYLRQPLLLSQGGAAGAVNLPESWPTGFFLLDTGHTRRASRLIEQFLNAHDGEMANLIEQGWSKPVERAITALIADDRNLLYDTFAQISAFQIARFPHFIPEEFHAQWNGGGAYRLKLCGAGGGGMLLGLANDCAVAERVFGSQLSWL
ncbi:mevalonate kinase [Lewinella aquimaris]|uniref:mevalonate kinase n=1 Tax=Neolewinella aquimaris TaxID=1835722 RepID=A0A840E202_9BACT|nr:hypothetical protein [Neolewinella aquimaris]MBB4079130.1 mevalonate kinase [Neolewinella aquimaris]